MKILFESDSISIVTTLRKGTPKIHGVFFRDIKEKVLGKGYELSLVFVGADRMRALNKQHRNKDYATDILSFDLDDHIDDSADDHEHDDHCDHDGHDGHGHGEKNASELQYGSGEIFINPEKARIKAKEFGRTFDNYVKFLFIHGLFHLKGHDHEDNESAEKMEKAEISVRKKFGI